MIRRIVCLGGILAIALASCTSPPPPERDPFGRTLADAVARAYQDHGTLKLSTVTTFSWERFYAFKPKQSPDQINAALGFHWATDYSDQTDTYCLLVFVIGKTVAHSLLFPRYQGDCKTIATGPYTPRTALFAATSAGKTTGGTQFLQLRLTGIIQ
jgi:hypothetical protein